MAKFFKTLWAAYLDGLAIGADQGFPFDLESF